MKIERYTFSCDKACRSYRSEGTELWTLTVPVRALPRGLKYGPNARYAALDNKPAREMLQTLARDPASFVLKNNGLMVVAHSIRVDGNEVELVCHEAEQDDDAPGHGVLNGGHTYKVLEHVLDSPKGYPDADDKACVMMTVGIGIPEEDIVHISRARNTSEKVPLHALRELAGDWSDLKKYLPKESRPLVELKPNDPEAPEAAYNMSDLVRRIALLNNEMFPAQENRHPIQAYTSIGTLVRQYRREQFLEVAPLLGDVLRLEEWVVRQWDEKRRGKDKLGIGRASGVVIEETTLLSGATVDLNLPAPFVLPVVAAFRVFVRDGKWAEPIEELWERFGARVVLGLWEAYKDNGRSSVAVFGRSKSTWAAACDLTKSNAIAMGLIKMD